MSQNSQVRTYDRAASVVFLKTNERFGGLSNMAPGFPLRVNGVRIRTSEALYQACRFPHMPEVQQLIIGENSPMTAKMRSKPYRRVSRHDWDLVRVKIMRWSLRVKLAQNWREFGKLLLATGDRPIVEQSRKDDFWGAKVADNVTLVGINVLGRLLMELREQLKGEEAEGLRYVEPPAISEFLLFGQPIEVVQAAPNAEIQGWPPQRSSQADAAPPPPCKRQPSLFEQPMTSNAEPASTPPLPILANDVESPKHLSDDRPSLHEWIGDLPSRWDVLRSKYLFREIDDRTDTGTETLLSMRQAHGLIPHAKVSTRPVTPEELRGYKRVCTGQIVLNRMQASNGMFAVAREDGLVSPDYAVFQPLRPMETDYFVDLFKTTIYRAKFRQESKGLGTGTSGFLRLYSDRFGAIHVPQPPEEEQRKIVQFIRTYDLRVRRLARNKRRFAELAAERLKLATQDALNSATAHEARIEVVAQLISRPIERTEAESFTPIGLYNRGRGYFKKPETLASELGDSDFFWIKPGDLILSGQFAWEGAVALADADAESCIASHRYPILRGRENQVDTAYLLAFFRSDYGGLLLDAHSRGAAGRNRPLNIRTLKKEKIPVPPMAVQKEIRQLIELETAIRKKLRLELQVLFEYRDRLIADVVTGKLDVRNIEIASLADAVAADADDQLDEELDADDDDAMGEANAEK